MEYTTKTLPKWTKTSWRAIYQILNTVSGKSYIGSAEHVVRRFNAHISLLRRSKHQNHRLQDSWNKYGEAHFRFIIIEIVPDDGDLIARENAAFNRLLPSYNINGDASLNPMHKRKHKPESIALMRQNRKGKGSHHRPLSEEAKAKLSAAHKGKPNPSAKRPRTEAEKKNLSDKAKARFAGGPIMHSASRAVEIDGISYPTCAHAALALEISRTSIHRFIARGRGRYLDGKPARVCARRTKVHCS
jgi:group I intron endonuclease